MGQDYSYTQPSSSDEYDLTSLLEAEAALYAEEAESSYNIGEPVQCPPQPFQYLCGGHTNAEQMRAFETQLSLLKDQVRESDQKLAKLEKTVCDELCKKTSWRRNWSPQEDLILIGAWLNTSKDAVKNTEQKAGASWKRIIDYYNASHLLVGTIPRELTPAKQRWARINADVSKFVGCYDQAMREQESVENDDDLMKAALHYYFKDQGHKFSMEHAWRELRRDQKWCSACKDGGKDKRKHVLEVDIDEEEGRPVGVKAAKATSKKKKSGKEEELSRLQAIMEIKQKLSSQKLFDRLLAKKVPLTEMETSLKLKLMSDMFSSKSEASHRCLWSGESVFFCSSCEASHGESFLCYKFVSLASYLVFYLVITSSFLFSRFYSGREEVVLDCCKALYKLYDNSIPLQRRDATGRWSLTALQKCTATIRLLAYDTAADTVDEYLRLGETTALSCLHNFTDGIIQLLGDEYLRRPTPEDLQRLLDIGEKRGFPGMFGIIDCMHWEWKNCPTAWKGQYARTLNDINVLDRSPVFDYILQGRAPRVKYVVNGHTYKLAYYLTDGIYPKWSTFIQYITLPQTPEQELFAKIQEATRKDVERAFGVLQSRFAIVRNPVKTLNKEKIEKIMRTCIILHNMIVEDERDGYSRIDISEFEEGDVPRCSEVESEWPTNLNNIFPSRNDLRDRQTHERLKNDLIQNIWNKFSDED
uniref:Myb-like domain-containing protein n=1 Tax=Brassica oleracea var. oleracea TaxID=109376 RepID=A0A0D3AC02_BRAOL